MALTFINLGAAGDSVSSATLPVTGITAAVGDLLIATVAADNFGTAGVSSTASVTDASGNTWTNYGHTNRTAGVVQDGTTLTVWACWVTVALIAATVTANFSPNTTSKAMVIQHALPAAGETVLIGTAGAGWTGSGTAFSTGNVSVTIGDVIVGFTANESSTLLADTDTTNGAWSTLYSQTSTGSGTQATSQTVGTQNKTVTATGNQSYDTGNAGTRDWATNYLILTTPPVARATQVVAETLSNATPNLRATQQAVEALSISNPAERVTQVVVEVLTTTEVLPLAALVSQQVIEVLSDNPAVSTGLAAGVATVMGAGQQAVEGVGLAAGVATVTGAGQSTFAYGNRLNITSS